MTPFHLRDRLKKLAQGVMGDPVASDQRAPSVVLSRPVAAPIPAAATTAAAAPIPAAAPPVRPSERPPAVALPPAPPEAGAAPGPTEAEKAKTAKHWQKTRSGMLHWLKEQGGAAPMSAMHDRSEARYFVAHRSFSRLMEEFTGEALVTYEGGVVTLTAAGKAAAAIK
ncbi:MAG: hypothetical protein EXR71_09925 [Myxococcales bacterium]|nr:hypothetical protein [Myxococcales bacterium]